MTVLSPAEAQRLATEFRGKFRNSDAFTAAWEALFSLKTTITPTLARRILGEELQRFRAHAAGLDASDFKPPAPVTTPPQPDTRYRCPGCHLEMSQWQKDEHAPGCEHAGCYEMQVRYRVAVARREAERAARKTALLAEQPMADLERA